MELIARHQLADTWPISDQCCHFELGHILNCAVTEAVDPNWIGALGLHHAGLWECDLGNDSLIWSGGVFDIFGLERRIPVSRDLALAQYTEDSRAKLERLRSYAIDHGLGFTLDVEIRAAAVGEIRRVRVIAAPVLIDEVPVRLHGLKLAL